MLQITANFDECVKELEEEGGHDGGEIERGNEETSGGKGKEGNEGDRKTGKEGRIERWRRTEGFRPQEERRSGWMRKGNEEEGAQMERFRKGGLILWTGKAEEEIKGVC